MPISGFRGISIEVNISQRKKREADGEPNKADQSAHYDIEKVLTRIPCSQEDGDQNNKETPPGGAHAHAPLSVHHPIANHTGTSVRFNISRITRERSWAAMERSAPLDLTRRR